MTEEKENGNTLQICNRLLQKKGDITLSPTSSGDSKRGKKKGNGLKIGARRFRLSFSESF